MRFALAILLFLAPALTRAGVISGGGGGALVCRNADGTVTSAELLDLWEAHAMGGQTIVHDSINSVNDQLRAAAAKLAAVHSGLAEGVLENWKHIQKNRVWNTEEVLFPKPDDADNSLEKKNCPLQGMMFYDDQRNKLILRKPVFNALKDNTEIAAAYFHEALYRAMRMLKLEGARNSVQTRIIVGCLFSEGDLADCLNLEPAQPANAWNCDLPADEANDEPTLRISLYQEKGAWKIVVHQAGSTRFGQRAVGNVPKKIQTLPGYEGPSGPGLGEFLLDESLRITGLENLGFPFTPGSAPYGSRRLTIWGLQPLTISHGDSPTYVRCRRER